MNDADRNRRSAGNRRSSGKAERARVTRPPGVPRGAGPDDPRAAAEARRRLGEFVAAFRARRPGDEFAVRVPFRDDYGREVLWVGVAAVTDTHFVGRVGDRPGCVRGVSYRQTVRVPRAGVVDWVYVRGATVVGGFGFRPAAGAGEAA